MMERSFCQDHNWTPTGKQADLQTVPRPVSVTRGPRYELPADWVSDWHSHRRSQLVYATRGIMTVAFQQTSWILPEGHGLIIDPELCHQTSALSPLTFCSAYIDRRCLRRPPSGSCRLVSISPLLHVCLQELSRQPLLYDVEGRGGALARLIIEEVDQASDALFPLPLPTDDRLQKLCALLIETPALDLDLDSSAETVGITRRTLTRRFRAETGLSFADWRRRLRGLRAIAQCTQGTPDDIAAQANGYASATALRSMIRRLMS